MSEVHGVHVLGLFCSGFTWNHKIEPSLTVKWELLFLFSPARFLTHMKVKQQDDKVSPRSSKNMKQGSQYDYADLVDIHAG